MKKSWGKIYRIGLTILISLCLANIGVFLVENLAMYVVSPSTQYCSIYESNLTEIGGMVLEGDSYITLDNDPQMIFTEIEGDSVEVIIEFAEPLSEDMSIAAYYGYFGKFYAFNCHDIWALEGSETISIEGVIHDGMEVRIDIGTEPDISYSISDIKVAIRVFEVGIIGAILIFILILALLRKFAFIEWLCNARMELHFAASVLVSMTTIWIGGTAFDVLYYGVLVFVLISLFRVEVNYIKGAKNE